MSNKKYEENAEIVNLPGGKNVRISYSRGCTVNTGNFNSEKYDLGYSADFEAKEALEKLAAVKSFVNGQLTKATKEKR